MFGSRPLLLLSSGNNSVGIRPSSEPFRANNNIPKNNSDKIDIERRSHSMAPASVTP